MFTRPVQLILLLGAFLLGLFAGRTPAFDITAKLSAGDLLGALMSLLMAVVLGVAVQKSFSDTRVEKNLLIGQTSEVSATLRTARQQFLQAVHDGPTEKSDREILSTLRLLSVQITALERAAATCTPPYESQELRSARSSFRWFRRLITERALSNELVYDVGALPGAEAAFGAISEALLLYSIEVNRR